MIDVVYRGDLCRNAPFLSAISDGAETSESELLGELKRSIAKVSFDQLPCPDTDPDSLDMERVKKAFAKIDREVDVNKLETLGVFQEG